MGTRLKLFRTKCVAACIKTTHQNNKLLIPSEPKCLSRRPNRHNRWTKEPGPKDPEPGPKGLNPSPGGARARTPETMQAEPTLCARTLENFSTPCGQQIEGLPEMTLPSPFRVAPVTGRCDACLQSRCRGRRNNDRHASASNLKNEAYSADDKTRFLLGARR